MADSKVTHSLKWRVVDFVVAAVLGVACGVIFMFWNWAGAAAFNVLDAATPGIAGLVTGIWYLGGTVGGLVIRKPGAAIFVETLAALISAILGSQWGISVIFDGLMQGLGAEVAFVILAYRKFGVVSAIFSGMFGAVGGLLRWGIFSGGWAMGTTYLIGYTTTNLISGAILCGLVGWFLVKALAKTGVLNRFAAGQEAAKTI